MKVGSTSVIAKSMMKNMGWEEGQGLGKSGQGMKHALKPTKKVDSSGLGAVSSNTKWLNTANAYDAILAKLNLAYSSNNDDDTSSVSSAASTKSSESEKKRRKKEKKKEKKEKEAAAAAAAAAAGDDDAEVHVDDDSDEKKKKKKKRKHQASSDDDDEEQLSKKQKKEKEEKKEKKDKKDKKKKDKKNDSEPEEVIEEVKKEKKSKKDKTDKSEKEEKKEKKDKKDKKEKEKEKVKEKEPETSDDDSISDGSEVSDAPAEGASSGGPRHLIYSKRLKAKRVSGYSAEDKAEIFALQHRPTPSAHTPVTPVAQVGTMCGSDDDDEDDDENPTPSGRITYEGGFTEDTQVSIYNEAVSKQQKGRTGLGLGGRMSKSARRLAAQRDAKLTKGGSYLSKRFIYVGRLGEIEQMIAQKKLEPEPEWGI